MKKNSLNSLYVYLFSSCAYKPIYKKGSLYRDKINILIKPIIMTKKSLLMKASLNQRLNSKKI